MPAWDNKSQQMPTDLLNLYLKQFPQESESTPNQYASINEKLNKILWKLQQMENHFQQGKVPVWIVKENPSWVQYDWWKIVSKPEEKP